MASLRPTYSFFCLICFLKSLVETNMFSRQLERTLTTLQKKELCVKKIYYADISNLISKNISKHTLNFFLFIWVYIEILRKKLKIFWGTKIERIDMKNCDFVERYKDLKNCDFVGRNISDREKVGTSTCSFPEHQRLAFCHSHTNIHGHTTCWSQQN